MNLNIPKPTIEDPFKQIKFLENRVSAKSNSKYVKYIYKSAVNIYIKYVKDTNDFKDSLKNKEVFLIEENWDIMALLRFANWLRLKNDKVTFNTNSKHISLINKLMDYAYAHNFISNQVLPVDISRHTERVTLIAESYSPEEEKIIKNIIENKFLNIKRIIKPYINKNIGRDPRNKNRKDLKDFKKEYGYRPEDNMIYYFEKIMDSKAIHNFNSKSKHYTFFTNAAIYHGGIEQLYWKWGVSSVVTLDLIMILIVRIAYLTGLNPESIFSLKRDCLKIHPLTNKYFIEYYKERSSGDSELHIPLFDEKELTFEPKDSFRIKETIEVILSLTSKLIPSAKNEHKNYLFLYQVTSVENTKTTLIKADDSKRWYKTFVKKYDLKDSKGNPLIFNLKRFRPTKLTELFKKDVELKDIKSVANHKSINTTFRYFSKNEVNKKFTNIIVKSLTSIKSSSLKHKKEQEVFKTSVSSCLDPYKPPLKLTKTNDFKEFNVCTSWSHCLLCPNILITPEHLPKIIAYKSQILVAMNEGIETMFIQSKHYKNVLDVIDDLLTEDNYFSKEELEVANKKSSDYLDSVIDDFIYQGVQKI